MSDERVATRILFQVIGLPVPQGSKTAIARMGKNGKPFAQVVEGRNSTDRKRFDNWRNDVSAEARRAYQGQPLDGPLRVRLKFTFPRPGSARVADHFKTTAPDLDKLIRAVFDALTAARTWVDDSRVAHVSAYKVLADREGVAALGVVIEVSELLDELP